MLVKLPKCEYCGGTKYDKDNETFVCLGCHKRYTVEELEKLPVVDVDDGNGPTLEERILRAQKIGTAEEWHNLLLFSGLIDDMEEKYGWERDFYREYCVANEIACQVVPADDSCRSAASFGRRLQEMGLCEKIAKTVPEEDLAKVLEEVYKRISEVVNLFFEKESGRYVNNNQMPTEPKEEFYKKLSLDYIAYTGFSIEVYSFFVMDLLAKIPQKSYKYMGDVPVRAIKDAIRLTSIVKAAMSYSSELAELCQKNIERYTNFADMLEKQLEYSQNPEAYTAKAYQNLQESVQKNDAPNNNMSQSNTAPKSTVNGNPANKKATGKQGCLVVVMALIIVAALCFFV